MKLNLSISLNDFANVQTPKEDEKREVSITVLRTPLEKVIPAKPGCLKNQQMERFEDNEPTKVLKDDCVSFEKK